MGEAPLGKLSERSIRYTLNSIKQAMRKPNITAKEVLKFLDHQQRLQGELKAVVAERLKAKVAALDAKAGESQ